MPAAETPDDQGSNTLNQQAAARFRQMIEEGRASGPGRPVTDDLIAELRQRALHDR